MHKLSWPWIRRRQSIDSSQKEDESDDNDGYQSIMELKITDGNMWNLTKNYTNSKPIINQTVMNGYEKTQCHEDESNQKENINDNKEVKYPRSLRFLSKSAYCVLKGQNIACGCDLPSPKLEIKQKSTLKRVRFGIETTVDAAGKRTERKLGTLKFNQENVKYAYDVYLGGAVIDTTWRENKAVPALREMGISYFNPKVNKCPEAKKNAWEKSKVILYVLESDIHTAESMVKLAYLAATEERFIVAVIEPYQKGQIIRNRKLLNEEWLELQKGQKLLQKILEKENVSVFLGVLPALRFIKCVLRSFAYHYETTRVKKMNKRNNYSKDLCIWSSKDGVDLLCQNEISSKLLKGNVIYANFQDDSFLSYFMSKTKRGTIDTNLEAYFDALVILFNIPNNINELCTLIMAAYCGGRRPNSLVVFFPPLNNEKLRTLKQLPNDAIENYRAAREELTKIIVSKNITVYESTLMDAVRCGIRQVMYLR